MAAMSSWSASMICDVIWRRRVLSPHCAHLAGRGPQRRDSLAAEWTALPRAETAETAEARSSAPTRQHLFGAAQLIMAAARILGGLRPLRVCGGELVLQRVDAQLYWKLGSSHGDGEHSPLLLKKND